MLTKKIRSFGNFEFKKIFIDTEHPVKLKGLKSEFNYKDAQTGEVYGGDMLMNKGYTFIFDDLRDFSTLLKHFRA